VLKGDVSVLKSDMSTIKTRLTDVEGGVSALVEAMLVGFKRSDEQHEETQKRIDQLELLVRQSLPKN
ncbi:hypothetical protein, partial [Sansalvadorimonas verongulae]|uniref:hypothetical protein n=1 Tax=Sansalvadorimonas verongulae TaxID=2172824 RepID=UPI001E2E4559